MKHLLSRYSLLFIIYTVLICLALSACSSSSGTASSAVLQKHREDVENTIEACFDELQGGDLIDSGYESEILADGNSFKDLAFPDEQCRTAMQTGMRLVTYDIKSTDIDSKYESAVCYVTFTAPDVRKIQLDLEEREDGLYYESFINAISNKEAPVREYDISLILQYDTNNEEWIIEDSSAIAALLGEPYTELVFDEKYYKAQEVIDSLMAALAAGDYETVDILCRDMDSSSFYPQDEFGLLLANAIYSSAEYTVNGTSQGTDTQVNMSVSITLPDMDANYIEAINDVDMVTQALKPAVLSIFEGGTGSEAGYAYRQAFYTELASRQKSETAFRISYDLDFLLTYDEEIENWRIASVQTERMLGETIEGYDPLFDLTEQHLQTAIEKASAELYGEGTIDQQQQGDINSYLYYVLIPEEGDPFANIKVTGWTDPSTGNPVEGYDSKADAALMYVLLMSSDWGDCTGHIEWYYQNAAVLLYEEDFTYTAGSQGIFAVYPPEEDPHVGWLLTDTYKVIIYLSDGSVLAESTVAVS